MRFRKTVVLLFLALLAAAQVSGQPAAPAPQGAAAPAESGLPAPLSGFSDSGTFYLYVNEDRVGTLRFKWQPDGSYENEATISLGGQSVTFKTAVAPDPDGRWVKLSMDAPTGPVQTVREGATARRTRKDKTDIITIKPESRLFDNYGPALMSQAVRLYDRAQGGKQQFPLIMVPGSRPLDASLELRDRVERSIAGRDLELYRYTYALPGVDVILWADRDGKVYLGDVPAQHAAFVREGYEALRQAETVDPMLSQPKYEVKRERNVSVPMRDGVKLAADIYLPQADGRFPVILVRTPYQKDMLELQARYYARRGYAVAVEDCRGRFASGGIWEPFVNEPRDGYDTIEWLARQPWSNGKVGMIGGSYVGWVQWWAARERPPHLVTIIPNVAPPDPLYNIPYEYGTFFILGGIWWADILESRATADLSGVALSRIGEKKYRTLLNSLPVIELDRAVLGKQNPYWRKWIQHPVEDPYWRQAAFLDRLREVRIPVFHQSGWFDGDGIGTKLNYLRMREAGHPYQKLVLGPWGHTDTAGRRIDERDFGPQAIIDLQRDYLRWFDYWLKGIDNGIAREPLVSMFVMGTNKWLRGETYPLAATRFTKLYLASGGQANTSRGDGRLTLDVPAGAASDRYVYDPADPTPDPRFDETTEEQDRQVRSVEQKKKEAEAYHESVTAQRRDILVYQTEPLQKPLTFAGPLSAVLYASSSARDTDWFVSLVEIEADGKTFWLATGKVRARYRRSMSRPEFLKPGQVYEYQLDLWHTGITIPAGHRLRVEVASALFPNFSRNLNTGGHNEMETKHVPAQQTVYHSPQYPSHVLLPVIPAEELNK
ncbi:MAG: CocE/NonD family hydrolase [Bryobacteraceae bacterium]|jgi:putative CocE/NonD family hydrolase